MMKAKSILAAVLILGAAQAQALPCIGGSLASYIGLGGGGCQIGSNTFSDFMSLTTIPTGATPVAASDILVTPVFAGPLGFGIDLGLNMEPVQNVFFDFLVSYRVAGNSYQNTSLLVNGVPPVDGVLSGITNLCRNGTYPTGISSCSSGPDLTLVAAQLPGDPLQTDTVAFLPASSLAVITDVGIDTGTDGTLSQVLVGNRFLVAPAAVPLPSVLALLIVGLGGMGMSRRYGHRGANRRPALKF
jgi:hypothetical protein